MSHVRKHCGTCRYWSQMCAMYDNERGMIAVCLAPQGGHNPNFVAEAFACPAWAENTHGAWDEPPDYGEQTRAQYESQRETRGE